MTADSAGVRLPASFRDPCGFVFVRGGELFRQVNVGYREQYDHLRNSGLYAALVSSGLLVPHSEVDSSGANSGAYLVIRPERIPFISYPYEWSFSQLRDAALSTLRIQRMALDHGMVLKDASAFNIQFLNAEPVLIDTLSFDTYREGEPWMAYRQFCQHFLAPLALMSHVDVRLGQLSKVYIDGPPLDMAAGLLPLRARMRPSLLIHLVAHAKSQARHANSRGREEGRAALRGHRKLGVAGMRGMIDSLESAVSGLHWRPVGTEWGDYYNDTNYSSAAMEEKKQLVYEYLRRSAARTVWDVGANTGVFSRLASEMGMHTVSFDIDPAAVEKNYLECRAASRKNLLPLIQDLTNPSPSLGWRNRERDAFLERGPVDVVLALALVHHLAISNNVPLADIADLFASVTANLVIEFVPKGDSQVRRLLASREDVFQDYTQPGFEQAFSRVFSIEEARRVADSSRMVYCMQRRW